MSRLIDQLKAQSGDARSERDLTLLFGQQVEQEGRKDVFDANPDFAQEYASLKDEIARLNRPSLTQEAIGGLKAGGSEMLAAGEGLGALAANAVGADSISQNLLGRARSNEEDAAQHVASVPSLSNISGDHPVEDTAYYLARGLGSMAPSLALGAASGGVGALVSRAIPIAASTLGELAVGSAFASQATGSNFVRHPDAPGADIGFGIASGALGAVAPGYVASRILRGAGAGVPESYVQRFLGEVAKTVPIGAAGTAASALTDIAAEKYARGEDPASFTADDYRAALNAGVIGGVGGALMAPFAAIPGGRDSAVSGSPVAPEAAPIDTAGLPPDIAAAVKTTEAVAEAINPTPLREAANNAIQIQGANEVPLGEAPGGGAGVRVSDQIGEVTPGARQPGPATEAPAEAPALKPLEPTWLVTNQSQQGDVPGYVQIDKVGPDGTSQESVSPETLRQQGYEVPDFSGIGQGQFRVQDAIERVAYPAVWDVPEPKVPMPSVENVMPVPESRFTSDETLNQSANSALRNIERQLGINAEDVANANAIEVGGVAKSDEAPLALESATLGQQADEAQQARDRAASEAQRSAIQAGSEAPLVGDSSSVGQGELLTQHEDLFSGKSAETQAADLATEEERASQEANATRPMAANPENAIVIPPGRSPRDMVRASSRIRAIDTELMKAKGEDRTALLVERLQLGADMGNAESQRALTDYLARQANPVADQNALIRELVAKRKIIIDPQGDMVGEIARLREGGVPNHLFRKKGATADELAEGIGEVLEANGIREPGETKLTTSDSLDLIEQAFREQPVTEPPKIIIPLVKKEVEFFTQRTSGDFTQPTTSSARLLDSTVRALTQDRGIPVVALEDGLAEAGQSAIKTAGMNVTGPAGERMVAYAVDALHGPLAPQSIISLMHEAAHVFTEGLPENLRVAAQRGIDELPWTQQRWLDNPESLDARLIATADPATLSAKQLDALSVMTPEEIAAARALPPETLVAERMAEHLAQLGWDKQQAVTFVDRLFRFIKDIWLQASLAIQKALKGDDQTSPELARQFTENRFLQFINRDAAYARDRINDLRNWIGVPQTTRERQPNFPGGQDAEMRMQFADPATGTLIPVSYGTYTPDSVRAYLQRAIDNAQRFVRERPAGAQTPEQVEFTKRVNFQKPMPLEPAATYNVKLASVNLEDEIYNGIRESRDIAGLLPRENGQLIDHAAFLSDWLKLPAEQHPEVMKADVLAQAKDAIDPLTGQPVAHDPAVVVSELPSVAETLTGKEKEKVEIQLSEQQDEALTQTILSLRDTQRRAQRTLTKESERLNDLIEQRAEQKNEFPKDAQKELDDLQKSTLIRSEVLKALIPQINALESKFDPRRSVQIYPTGEYPRVPSQDADEAAILSHRRGTVPRDLNFSTDASKAQLGQDLADMQAWLQNPENRAKGAIYGTIDEAYRKLMQIPTDLKRVHTTVLLRRTITNGLAEELRLTGIPSLVAFGKKLLNVSRIANENRVESHNLGVKWEVAFAGFAKSLGLDPDQTFRETWWDPLNRIWDRVDVSRRAELTDPAKWRTPIDQVAKALNQVTGLEIKTDAQRAALRDLMLVTTDNNRHFMSVELQNDIRVQDDKLGFERRLVPRGVVGGRRTFARHLMGLFARMNPDWSDTSAKPFWDGIADLYTDDRPAFDAQMKKLFPSYVVNDFVEPWVNDNDPVFSAPTTGEDSTPRMAAPNRVRRAWRDSKGDVTRFAEILHGLEGGDDGDEVKTVQSVLKTLHAKFYEQKGAVDQQLGRQQIGSEIVPRQLMDARVAHNWPAEHVSYATYTPLDNAMVLSQLALGASLGHDALGANSEMHMTLSEARRDLAELWSRHEELVQQGRSPKQIEAIMGRDDAKIARNYYALNENVKHIEQAIVGMTMNSGYLLNDFKAMNAAVGFFSSMMVQNPRSGAVNIIGDIQGPLAALKFSSQGLRAFRDSTVSVARDMATAVVRAFGYDAKFNADLAHELYVNGAVEPEAAVTWRQKQHFGAGTNLTKPSGYETVGAKISRNITRLAARGREIAPNVGSPFQVPFRIGDEQAAVAPKLRAGFFGTTAMSTQFANNRAGYNLFAQLANRGVEYINSLPAESRQAAVRALELGTKDMDARQLGYNRGLVLNDEAAFAYIKNAIETQMSGESSVGRFAAKAFRRQEQAVDGKWPILANSQFSDIINLTNSYWTLQNNFATVPPWMNGPLRPLFIFLTWPYQAMHRFGQTFTDPRGRLTFNGVNSTVGDGMKTFFLLAAPATIAGSFAIDLYDKYALGKKQNLREASLATALPGVGALVNPAAFMERIGRYGSAGFATDLMNRLVNYDTQRNLSLDDRIVAVSSIESLLNAVAVEPFQTGGNITYSSTVRPFLQAIGGGGVLQYLQVANNLLGLNNEEAAINARINTGNYLRAAGRELQLPVRVMTGPSEAPTPTSPYLRQMELGATLDNPELFRSAYQNAVQAARDAGHEDAERYVAQNFADRHPLRRIFRTTPTEGEYRRMLGLMGDLGSQQVRDSVNSYNRYLATYFNRPAFYGRVEKDVSVDQLIRQASRLQVPDYQLAGR